MSAPPQACLLSSRYQTYTVVTSCELNSSENRPGDEGNAGEKHAGVEYAPVVDGGLAEDFRQWSSVVLTANVPYVGVKLATTRRPEVRQ